MLKQLYIHQLILVEEAELHFTPGLNVLTGETGSGKSAVLHSLHLICGERADASLIRKGCEKAIVEAVFEINHLLELKHFLEQAGIEHENDQPFIVRRELTAQGKGRSWINHQLVQQHFLREIGSMLIHMVGQHANQKLFSTDYHRYVVDLFGDLQSLIDAFQASFKHELLLKDTLEQLIQQEGQRLREIDQYQRELTELEEAQLREGEEDELFAEYTKLSRTQELRTKAQEVYQLLGGDRHTLIQSLQRSKNILDTLLSIDPNLQEAHTSLHNAHVELQEVIHLLRHYQGNLHHEPERFEWLQERLSVIHRLKRKYGNTIDSIHAYQKQIKSQLDQLINADLKIETLQEELKQATITTQQSALILTEARQKTIQNLEQALNQHLQSLNMPKAQFFIKLTPQKRSMQGDEKIEFFLIPNVGEHHIALKEGASGGEMARILLAIQTLLAGKEQVGTLIFDEVDASIGGETATRIGQKLQEIGHQHQVICITHFPQVAAHAAHHLQISKQEKDGRTMTFIRSLDSATKGHELQRMTGGKQTFIN